MKDFHILDISIDPGHEGVWPGMEPAKVRAAYDKAAGTSPLPEQVFSKDALLARGGSRG
ncbi:hypothetical protein [Acrocarpospora catenulata]|uniref:hypothetical protein n=1 Tax=Acrocarpospora catenulata TaxID=2836182 RepID=UPI001BDB438E|nr:hypothetical protein [Acrocarpospora catenulata]